MRSWCGVESKVSWALAACTGSQGWTSHLRASKAQWLTSKVYNSIARASCSLKSHQVRCGAVHCRMHSFLPKVHTLLSMMESLCGGYSNRVQTEKSAFRITYQRAHDLALGKTALSLYYVISGHSELTLELNLFADICLTLYRP